MSAWASLLRGQFPLIGEACWHVAFVVVDKRCPLWRDYTRLRSIGRASTPLELISACLPLPSAPLRSHARALFAAPHSTASRALHGLVARCIVGRQLRSPRQTFRSTRGLRLPISRTLGITPHTASTADFLGCILSRHCKCPAVTATLAACASGS